MRINDFIKLYDLNEADIKDIYYEDNKLIILASFDFYQEFIANGCRSDFDYEVLYKFGFTSESKFKKALKYKINKIEIKNNSLELLVNDDLLVLVNDVDIEKK